MRDDENLEAVAEATAREALAEKQEAPRDDSGPAFPDPAGMSLRDWFAGQALVGQITAAGQEIEALAMVKTAQARGLKFPDLTAGMAYEYADAMLKARE